MVALIHSRLRKKLKLSITITTWAVFACAAGYRRTPPLRSCHFDYLEQHDASIQEDYPAKGTPLELLASWDPEESQPCPQEHFVHNLRLDGNLEEG
jgi:hypothetical protein